MKNRHLDIFALIVGLVFAVVISLALFQDHNKSLSITSINHNKVIAARGTTIKATNSGCGNNPTTYLPGQPIYCCHKDKWAICLPGES